MSLNRHDIDVFRSSNFDFDLSYKLHNTHFMYNLSLNTYFIREKPYTVAECTRKECSVV